MVVLKIGGCAGHGINTAGKRTPDGEREWSFNNKVWLAFERTLKLYEGVVVKRFDDPTGATDVPLDKRTSGANAWGADLYVSFHQNAFQSKWGTHTGTETYTWGSGKSLEIGKLIHQAMLSAFGLRDRGVKDGKHLWIVKATKMPAVLSEGGFMDSTIDIKKLLDDKVLAKAGENVAHAVAKAYGRKLKVVPKPAPAPPTVTAPSGEVLYRVVTGSFKNRNEAKNRVAKLKQAGFDSFIDIFKK